MGARAGFAAPMGRCWDRHVLSQGWWWQGRGRGACSQGMGIVSHRMVWVGRDLAEHPHPVCRQGCLRSWLAVADVGVAGVPGQGSTE